MSVQILTDFITWLGKIPSSAISLLTGFICVVVGSFLASWLNSRRDSVQRKIAFLEKQLSEFYSPMPLC